MKVVLEDSGNLVLQGTNGENVVLWQSFDYPTDTFLPGMKLGVSRGRRRSLTSWLTQSIPASGAFTLKWDPERKRLVVRLRERVLWTSGENFGNILSLDPLNMNYNFTHVSNQDELYLYYTLLISHYTPEERRKNARLVLLNSGILELGDGLIMFDSRACAGDSTENGCEKWEGPKCRNKGDKYEKRSVIPTHKDSINNTLVGNISLSINDCKDICWKDCNCLGVNEMMDLRCQFLSGPYDQGGLDGTKGDKYEKRSVIPTHKDSINNTLVGNISLSINDCKDICWKDCNCLGVNEMMDLRCQFLSGPYDQGGLDGTSYQVIIRSRSKSKNWIWILISIAMALMITILLAILFYLRRRRQIRMEEKFLLDLMTSDDTNDTRELQTGNNGHNLNIYTAALIMSATNSFSPENLLGKGGFGPVFKGTLPDGQEVAIKRLSRGSGQGLVEFKNELILIAKLQHTNLVRLLGFCVQGEEKMLVYEYMPNKSLDSFIFDESKRKLLDWDKRFSIIEGIAQGLLYLHKYSRLRIIHRDLKVSNILLDDNMNPKISDFGMARIYKTNEAESNTNRIVGTYGYMAPEYAMDGISSEKSDVYSFGVMVLEVVSGRKNNSNFQFDRPLNLVGYAWELWKHGAALELMDPTLSDSYSKHQVLRCITLGLLCVEESPLDRPTMSNVISGLNGEMQLPLPKHPAFSTGRRIIETNVGDKEMENFSVNGLTMSTMDAR